VETCQNLMKVCTSLKRIILSVGSSFADDFIVDELGRPINRKKGGDQNTDMYVNHVC